MQVAGPAGVRRRGGRCPASQRLRDKPMEPAKFVDPGNRQPVFMACNKLDHRLGLGLPAIGQDAVQAVEGHVRLTNQRARLPDKVARKRRQDKIGAQASQASVPTDLSAASRSWIGWWRISRSSSDHGSVRPAPFRPVESYRVVVVPESCADNSRTSRGERQHSGAARRARAGARRAPTGSPSFAGHPVRTIRQSSGLPLMASVSAARFSRAMTDETGPGRRQEVLDPFVLAPVGQAKTWPGAWDVGIAAGGIDDDSLCRASARAVPSLSGSSSTVTPSSRGTPPPDAGAPSSCPPRPAPRAGSRRFALPGKGEDLVLQGAVEFAALERITRGRTSARRRDQPGPRLHGPRT